MSTPRPDPTRDSDVEAEFAARWFTNAADAFDTVKAYVLERGSSK